MNYPEHSSGVKYYRLLLAGFLAICLIGSSIPAIATGPSNELGFIYVDPHIDPTIQFSVVLEDADLDVDQSDVDIYLFHVSAGETTAARPLAMGSSTLELRVNGAPVELVSDFDLDFIETADSTGIFQAEFDPLTFNTTAGLLQNDDILDFVYGDSDPSETTITTTAAGKKERTYLVLNPIESVVTGTNVTYSGTLYSLETGMELSGKDITFVTSPPTSITIETAGIIFDDPNMELTDCSTVLPAGIADGSDTQDIADDAYPDCLPDDGDGMNNVLHMFPPEAPGIPGGTIIFPSGTEVVTLQLQNMGNAGVTIRVTKDTSPPTTFDVTSLGYCPDVANVNVASEDGIRQIEILEVVDDPSTASPFLQCQSAGDQSVGISRIETFDPNGNPAERHVIDFEELSLGPVPSPLAMAGGSFFVTVQAPSTAQIVDVRAVFNGDGDYLPSESEVQRYAVIEPTVDVAAGGGGVASGVVPDSDVGITTISCIADSDKDGLCNSWESIGSTAGIPYKNDAGSTQYYKLSTVSSDLHLSNPDIWVEIDYMGDDSTTPEDESHRPLPEALERVRAKFLARPVPVYLHYFIDEPIPHVSALNAWLDIDSDETNDFYNIKQNHFGTSSERGGIDLRDNNKLKAKAQAYHYALFAHSIGPCAQDTDPEAPGTQSGLAEVNGNDFIVSLGCGFASNASGHDVGTENDQAGTFMHELGHNLNLDHGGPREFITLPSGYATFPTTSTRQQYTITDNGPAGPSGDTSRKFTVKGLSVLTPEASSGTIVITMSVHFVDSANLNLNPGLTTVGTVTRSIPSGSTIIVDSITPSISEHSTGAAYIRQVNLKVDFTAPGSMTSTSGNLGTFTVPLTITDPNARIKSFTTSSTPPYSPRLLIDIDSTDYTENCKPNYPSVMSYSQQFSNIYDDSEANPSGYVWYPTYSNWTGTDLNESQLDESVGLGGNNNYIVFYNGERAQVAATMDPQINWKAVGNGIVQNDINHFGFIGCGIDNEGNVLPASYDILKGFDDWGNLHYNFKEGMPAIDGVYPNSASLFLREGPIMQIPPVVPPILDPEEPDWRYPLIYLIMISIIAYVILALSPRFESA